MADIYTYMQWRYNVPSGELVKKLEPEELYSKYYPLHETCLLYTSCMNREQMPLEFKSWYEENVQVYHVGSGIPLNLMDQSLYGKMPEHKREDIMLDQLTDILGSAYSLPITQLAELRSAIKGVYEDVYKRQAERLYFFLRRSS